MVVVHNQCQLYIRQDITSLEWVSTDQPLALGIVILVTKKLAQYMVIIIALDVQILHGVCMGYEQCVLQTQEMLSAVEFIHKQHASAMQVTQEWQAGAPHGRIIQLGHSYSPQPIGQEPIVNHVQLEHTSQPLVVVQLVIALLASVEPTQQ